MHRSAHAAHGELAPRARNFVVFSAGQGASSIGTWMQKTAIGWTAWELTHSPAWVGAIALTELFAALWVAPLAGAVTDRSNPYKLLWTMQLVMLLLPVCLWQASLHGWINIGLLFGFALLDATANGFNQPARMVVTGILAGPERMSQAIASNSIAVNVARSIGPMLAGLLMLNGQVHAVFLANALSFLAMLAAVIYVRRWIDRAGFSSRANLRGDIHEGFRYIAHTPGIAMLFAFTIAFSLLVRPFTELFPAFAGQVFHGGPQTLSMLMSGQGFGALFGAVWMLRRRKQASVAMITLGTALGLALALLLFTATSHLAVAVSAMAVAGMLHVVCNISMQSLAQWGAVPEMRGRVMALYGLVFRCGPALGAFLIGLAAHYFSLRWLVGGAAFAFGVLVLTCWSRARLVFQSMADRPETGTYRISAGSDARTERNVEVEFQSAARIKAP